MPHKPESSPPRPVILIVPTAAERRAIVRGCGLHPEGRNLLATARILQTGVGAGKLRRQLESALANGASGLISAGCAGALSADLQSGALLLPKRVRRLDGGSQLADGEWHRQVYGLLSHEFPVCSDDILHSDTVISDAAVKQALLQRTGASAVDMESGTVADVAATAGVPFLVLRAVADPAAHGVPAVALSALDADGGLDRKALLQRLASSPSELRSLLRLMLQFRRAARTLRQAMALGAELLLRERDPADGHDSQTATGANS